MGQDDAQVADAAHRRSSDALSRDFEGTAAEIGAQPVAGEPIMVRHSQTLAPQPAYPTRWRKQHEQASDLLRERDAMPCPTFQCRVQ